MLPEKMANKQESSVHCRDTKLDICRVSYHTSSVKWIIKILFQQKNMRHVNEIGIENILIQ
jgi:hypothetical protein